MTQEILNTILPHVDDHVIKTVKYILGECSPDALWEGVVEILGEEEARSCAAEAGVLV